MEEGTSKTGAVGADQEITPAISLPSSPPGEVEGEIIDLGNGDPSEFKRREKDVGGG